MRGASGGTRARGGNHLRRGLPVPGGVACAECGEAHPGLVHSGRWLVRSEVTATRAVELAEEIRDADPGAVAGAHAVTR